ncbi:helix-turn-helix domain-containing protein [Paenibacillus sp. MER 180]|uniref:helix-turn-helix domain-containing protein n=1 Tax=Paenibacillus sp. MER 180 TaxID=2939570 RepID=UPI002040393D|nr:helix-turn-helix transcriptional regulator [Paenibacillus sp. MER 180]MCM3292018.1 helix-turn-helix domain-containing protein [Paenibacillus sp. MER 180]
MGSISAVYSTLGELIQRYRYERSMTQAKLAELTRINRGSISKIENGDIKRPDYATIQPIISVLNVPLREVIDALSLTDHRSDTWFGLLHNSTSSGDYSLSAEIASYLLASRNEESEVLLGKLFQIVQEISNDNELKLSLLNIVITYARSHGIQRFVARGTLHKYLIERDDFSKMEATYQTGQYVLYYVEFLSRDERVTLYYKLGVHAFNLRKYNDCIELSKKAVIEDDIESSFKAYSTLAICTSYYELEQFDMAEKYLKTFSLFSFPFVQEYVDFMSAKLQEKKGSIELAIEQLKYCLETSSFKMNIVNSLFNLFLINHDLTAIENLLQREQEYIAGDQINPAMEAEKAHFYLNKGKYLQITNRQEEAVDCYICSASIFVRICEQKYLYECLELVFQIAGNINDKTISSRVQELFDNLKKYEEEKY